MNDMEMNYITNILQGKRPFNSEVDWCEIIGFTQFNKISGYFYQRLIENRMDVPMRVQKQYLQIFDWQIERNRRMGEWAKKIGEALEQERIPYAFLKGTVLSHVDFRLQGVTDRVPSNFVSNYENGERVSNDIDLLVAPKEIGKVEHVLLSLGFVQGYYNDSLRMIRTLTRKEILERRLNRGETVPFQLITNNVCLPHVEVDINFSLDYLPTGMRPVLDEMLEKSVRYVTDNGGMLRSLEEVDFLIHLLLHQYKEMRVYSMVMRGKDLEIYKLLDIYLMMKRMDQRVLWERIIHYGISVQAAVVLKTVKAIFDMKFSEEIQNAIECLEGEAEYVIAPDMNNKQYVWTASVWERIKRFDHAGMLVEI